MEYWSTMMTLLVEGVGEAAPQLILQIFTILSEANSFTFVVPGKLLHHGKQVFH